MLFTCHPTWQEYMNKDIVGKHKKTIKPCLWSCGSVCQSYDND